MDNVLVLSPRHMTVALQFSFNSERQLPHWMAERGIETVDDHEARKTQFIPGRQFITPWHEKDANTVSPLSIVDGLLEADYHLAEVVGQKRLRAKGKGHYFMARYGFARNVPGIDHPRFGGYLKQIISESRRLTDHVLWRARGFDNTMTPEGVQIDTQSNVSLNFEARNPLYENGNVNRPITKWQLDEQGARIGDKPIPIAATHYLLVEDGQIELVEAAKVVFTGEPDSSKNETSATNAAQVAQPTELANA